MKDQNGNEVGIRSEPPPLAIGLIDKEIAKHRKDQNEYLRKRDDAQKDLQIAQDCVDLYESFILDLQQSKEAILTAQPVTEACISGPPPRE